MYDQCSIGGNTWGGGGGGRGHIWSLGISELLLWACSLSLLGAQTKMQILTK